MLITLTVLLTSCCLSNKKQTRVVVIPADKEVIYVKSNECIVRPLPSWSVPDARMKEILDALNKQNGVSK